MRKVNLLQIWCHKNSILPTDMSVIYLNGPRAESSGTSDDDSLLGEDEEGISRKSKVDFLKLAEGIKNKPVDAPEYRSTVSNAWIHATTDHAIALNDMKILETNKDSLRRTLLKPLRKQQNQEEIANVLAVLGKSNLHSKTKLQRMANDYYGYKNKDLEKACLLYTSPSPRD